MNTPHQFKYFPHTETDIKEMLNVIGVNSLDELYSEVPEELKLHKELDIPSSKSEIEIREIFDRLCKNNKPLICFAGGGAYDHYTPSLVPYITSRSEFSTSYTPYQAEISQGTLQYIFEYQTLMAELTGMDISNASMYDGATATAEAMMMMVAAAKKRNKVLVSGTLQPHIASVVETYAKFHGVDLVKIAEHDGETNKNILSELLDANDVAGVILQQPNKYGIIEDFSGIAEKCHETKALLAINAPASPLAVLKSPGEWGADIACGDAQSLGIPLNYGGPYIGYLCTKQALVRKMPGRLVGGTTDANGERCFVLTMQAREQHIRREKATSNICTAQGIMCLYVAAYLSLMGPQGMKQVNENSYKNSHYLQQLLLESGKFEKVYNKPFLNEFCLRYKGDVAAMRKFCAENGFLAGIPVEGDDHLVLFAATEKQNEAQIHSLVEVIKAINN